MGCESDAGSGEPLLAGIAACAPRFRPRRVLHTACSMPPRRGNRTPAAAAPGGGPGGGPGGTQPVLSVPEKEEAQAFADFERLHVVMPPPDATLGAYMPGQTRFAISENAHLYRCPEPLSLVSAVKVRRNYAHSYRSQVRIQTENVKGGGGGAVVTSEGCREARGSIIPGWRPRC